MDPFSVQPEFADDSYCNSWAVSPEPPVLLNDALYGPKPYDINFCYPYLPKSLEAPQVRLVPFIPRFHAEAFFLHAREHPEDFQHMHYAVPNTLEDMLTWFEYNIRRNPQSIVLALMFADEDGKYTKYGGVLSLTNCEPDRLYAEVSMGISFRSFVGRGGGAIATALLVRYCMNLPTESPPGLGLRKLGWTSHARNYAAHGLAREVGFRVESTKRWNRLAGPGKESNRARVKKGDPIGVPGIDDFFLVLSWDEWVSDGKESVGLALNRTYTSKQKTRSAKL